MTPANRPAAPPGAGGSVDARNSQIGSIGEGNTVVVTFQETRRVEWRVWFVAPVVVAAGLVWLFVAATALGPTIAWLVAGFVAVVVLAGLTVWQTVRTHTRQRTEARDARSAALQPLELPPLPAGVQSVSTLIAPERALAPLEGGRRERDRDTLRDWCLDPAAPVVRILDGPSGVGKTRLAVETGRVLPEGWVAGRCVPGRALDVLPLVRACAEPTLAIVDDADTHPDIARLLDQLTATPEKGPPVKVLLVVRDAGAFTRSVQGRLRGAVEANWPVTRLSAIGEASDRPRWFANAVKAYARATGRAAPPGLETNRTKVGGPDEAMILTQVRAALTVLAKNPAEAAGYRTAPVDDLVAALIGHEQERWREAAQDSRWKLPDGLTAEACDDAMLALVVLAPTTVDEAVKVLRRLPRLRPWKKDLANVADWAHHVYPGTTTGGPWADPAPDFVLGALLAHLAAERTDLVSGLDLAGAAEKRPEVLLRLVRAAAQFSSVAALTDATLDRAPELIPAVVEHVLVIAATDPATRAVVIRLVTAHPITAEDAQRLLSRVSGVQWNQLRVALQNSLVQTARAALLESDDDRARGHLANVLYELGSGLREIGRDRDACNAFAEVVELRRELAEREPDRYTPDLAQSLSNLGASLRQIGRPRDALSVVEEVVDMRRELVRREPDRYTPGLALSLNNLGISLRDVGRPRDALTTDEEAIKLRRALARREPDRYTSDLADSLTLVAVSLYQVGRLRDSLTAAEEAVTLHRALARRDPDRYNPDLAMSLNNLGNYLRELGRPRDALAIDEEALELRRELARREPDRYTPDLARSLTNVGSSLYAVDRNRDALAATEEAVELRRLLARREPDRYNPDLALSLNNLANYLRRLGRSRDALKTDEEAVKLRRALARREPDRYLPDLAVSLNNLGLSLDDLEQHQNALAAKTEAVALYRELVQHEPDRYTSELAASLNNLGISLAELDEHQHALAIAEEAVALNRGLVQRDPDRHTPDLRLSLNNLAATLLGVGRRDDALACRGEAVARLADLAHRRPDDFRVGYERERAALARFCTDHDYPPGAALRAESEATRRLGLITSQLLVDLDKNPQDD